MQNKLEFFEINEEMNTPHDVFMYKAVVACRKFPVL